MDNKKIVNRWVLFLVIIVLSIGLFLTARSNDHLLGKNEPNNSIDVFDHVDAGSPNNVMNKNISIDKQSSLELANHSAVKSYQQLRDFQQRSQETFSNIDELTDDEKNKQLNAISTGVEIYEKSGKLVPAEALLLRLAILKYSIGEESELKRQSQELIELYKENSHRREQQNDANPDPRFILYKEQEQTIVKEVLDRDDFPNGASRSQYLRERLKEARLDIYKEVKE